MKTYRIPINWQVVKDYVVEAETLQEAVTKALDQFLGDTSCEGDYIYDSFSVDEIITDEYPEENWNYTK